jgi:hypothetical protein
VVSHGTCRGQRRGGWWPILLLPFTDLPVTLARSADGLLAMLMVLVGLLILGVGHRESNQQQSATDPRQADAPARHSGHRNRADQIGQKAGRPQK